MRVFGTFIVPKLAKKKRRSHHHFEYSDVRVIEVYLKGVGYLIAPTPSETGLVIDCIGCGRRRAERRARAR